MPFTVPVSVYYKIKNENRIATEQHNNEGAIGAINLVLLMSAFVLPPVSKSDGSSLPEPAIDEENECSSSFEPLSSTKKNDDSLSKDVVLRHSNPGPIGLKLVNKISGGIMVQYVSSRKVRRVRKGMTLISINGNVLDPKSGLNDVLDQLNKRPIKLRFRPAPRGFAVHGEPDRKAPPTRPTINDRVEALKFSKREKRKAQLKKEHFKTIQRYRKGPPMDPNNEHDVIMSEYRSTFDIKREERKAMLKRNFFRAQWENRYQGYVKTLNQAFDAMDIDGDGELTKHEIFKAIVLDEYVKSLLQSSPSLWNLLSPFQFHSSWRIIDQDASNSVTRDEFIGFAMNAEVIEGDCLKCKDDEMNQSSLDLDESLVKLFKAARRWAGGVDPNREQLANYLDDAEEREKIKGSFMKAFATTFSLLTSRNFLQWTVAFGNASTQQLLNPEHIGKQSKDGTKLNRKHFILQGNLIVVSITEFLSFGWCITTLPMGEVKEHLEEAALTRLFLHLDRNDDGFLTKSEVQRTIMRDAPQLEAALRGFEELRGIFHPRNLSSLRQLLDEADVDGDGGIELDEFIGLQRQLKCLSAAHHIFDAAVLSKPVQAQENKIKTALSSAYAKSPTRRLLKEKKIPLLALYKTIAFCHGTDTELHLHACGQKLLDILGRPSQCLRTLRRASIRSHITRKSFIGLLSSSREELARRNTIRLFFRRLDSDNSGLLSAREIRKGIMLHGAEVMNILSRFPGLRNCFRPKNLNRSIARLSSQQLKDGIPVKAGEADRGLVSSSDSDSWITIKSDFCAGWVRFLGWCNLVEEEHWDREKQTVALRELFACIDKNDDGTLSRKELKSTLLRNYELVSSCLQELPEIATAFSPKNLHESMVHLGLTKSSLEAVNFQMFAAWSDRLKIIAKQKLRLEKTLQRIFNVIDSDGSGVLSREVIQDTLLSAHDSIGKALNRYPDLQRSLNQENLVESMLLLKTGKEAQDEIITFKDWTTWFETLRTSAQHEAEREKSLRQLFRKLDSDGDGYLGKNEIESCVSQDPELLYNFANICPPVSKCLHPEEFKNSLREIAFLVPAEIAQSPSIGEDVFILWCNSLRAEVVAREHRKNASKKLFSTLDGKKRASLTPNQVKKSLLNNPGAKNLLLEHCPMLEYALQPDRLEVTMASIDSDGDQRLSLKEWVQWVESLYEKARDERLMEKCVKEFFEYIKMGSCDVLTAKEIGTALTRPDTIKKMSVFLLHWPHVRKSFSEPKSLQESLKILQQHKYGGTFSDSSDVNGALVRSHEITFERFLRWVRGLEKVASKKEMMIGRLTSVFEAINVDGSTKVSKKNIYKWLKGESDFVEQKLSPFPHLCAAVSPQHLKESIEELYNVNALSKEDFISWVQSVGVQDQARVDRKKRLTQIFQFLDKDCSGMMTRKQIMKRLLRDENNQVSKLLIPSKFPLLHLALCRPRNISQTVSGFEVNNNGSISLSEFIRGSENTWCKLHRDQIKLSALEALFQAMDRDGGGTLSKEEISVSLLKHSQEGTIIAMSISRFPFLKSAFHPRNFESSIKSLDQNGDGEITLEEFILWCKHVESDAKMKAKYVPPLEELVHLDEPSVETLWRLWNEHFLLISPNQVVKTPEGKVTDLERKTKNLSTKRNKEAAHGQDSQLIRFIDYKIRRDRNFRETLERALNPSIYEAIRYSLVSEVLVPKGWGTFRRQKRLQWGKVSLREFVYAVDKSLIARTIARRKAVAMQTLLPI